MTDRNSSGLGHPDSEDDPFAELTRIMGFDPRLPAKPAAVSPIAAPVVAQPVAGPISDAAAVTVNEAAARIEPRAAIDEPVAAHDFEIDLERELMGEFDIEPEQVFETAASVDNAMDAPPVVDREPEAAMAAESDQPMAAEPQVFTRQAEPMAIEPASVHSLAGDVPAAVSPSAIDLADEIDPDATSLEIIAPATQAMAVMERPAADAAMVEDDAGIELAADANDQFASFDEIFAMVVQDRYEEPAASRDEPTLAAPVSPAIEAVETDDEFLRHADPFAPDVDDFAETPSVADHEQVAPLPSFASMRGAVAASGEERVSEAVEQDPDDLLAREYEVSDEATSAPHGQDAPVHRSENPPSPAQRFATEAAPDLSLVEGLEDELNALLGNELSAASAAQAALVLPAYAAARPAPASKDVSWPASTMAAAPIAPEPNAGSKMSSAARNFSAGLDAWRQRTVVQAPVRAAPQPVVPVAAPVEPDDVLDDFELDIDDAAFDDAISNSIAQEALEAERSLSPRETTVPFKQPESAMSRESSDPYAALAALSANLKTVPSWPEPGEAHRTAFDRPSMRPMSAVHDMPEIDTVDVPEQAVALADDLDLPDFAFEEPSINALNDLDAEFANLLNDMKTHETEPAAAPASYPKRREDYASPGYAMPASLLNAPVSAPLYRAQAAPSYDDDMDGQAPTDMETDDAYERTARDGLDEFDFDPDYDDDGVPAASAQNADRRPSRRGLLIAGVVAGIAILGGIGALAMSSSGVNGSGEIALVKADPTPVKIKPENPGGTSIPNQDSKVYDSVAGSDAAQAPQQDKLLSSAEEPVDIPLVDEGSDDLAAAAAEAGQMPGLSQGEDDSEDAMATTGATTGDMSVAKGEDRLEQAMNETAGVDSSVEVAAVAPRKVRTMIVKADGSLVAREEPAAAPAEAMSPAPPSDDVADQGAPAGVPDAASSEAAAPDAAPSDEATASKAALSAMPAKAPIAPSRPSDQPVDIVGEVKPVEVAAVSQAAGAGAWSMQIASQPSEAAAQSSYQDLQRRYGSVLGGHQANIVKAEISGKGTFWRVRVPAGSRSDAVQLCERYKGAGGNCFVSK